MTYRRALVVTLAVLVLLVSPGLTGRLVNTGSGGETPAPSGEPFVHHQSLYGDPE